ncbi:hypothetical protein IFR04_006231 [Cadophora malorum]|uniref:CDAN1-interacting nuclease 1 n=1 Tax=Cadophora malorum TaxID=108018 RepID=A0A8H7W7R3_9HELO|nr:hypothetical protein IFR04_006231 [Cadophora malorum]
MGHTPSTFGSQQALQQHLDSPAHTTKNNNAYLGIHRSIVDPVYATAVRLRFEQPTVNDIRRKTGTELDETIVSSLIGAARRLLPIDNTPQGNALRIEQHRIKLADSKRAEDTFCAELDRLGYVFLREAQQEGEAVTPDVRFIKPTNVCGHLCMWLEYKNYFGFRSNPYVAPASKSQYQKYGAQIGPGAVVYKLGFESGHVNIDRVMTFREKEVLQDLKMRSLRR